jgi:hypothetical protein
MRSNTLPPTADRFLSRFLSDANIQMLHPLDWERFYEFVAVCHRTQVSLARDIKPQLQTAGFDEANVNILLSVYAHGRRLLKAKPYLGARYRNHDSIR